MTRFPVRLRPRASASGRALLTTLSLLGTLPAAAADTPALVTAAENGDRQQALALLESHVDLTAPSPDGTTALHFAVLHDDVDLARRLLGAGANPSDRKSVV